MDYRTSTLYSRFYLRNSTNFIKKTMESSSFKSKWDGSMAETSPVLGVTAGAFDVIHPGYIEMFNEAANNCDKLFVCLHVDPSIERPLKPKPILSVDERTKVLTSLTQVYYVVPYHTEKELALYLYENKFDVRFLGEDYKDKNFTGKDLDIPIHWIKRDHGWSTTLFKKKIYESVSMNIN